MLLIRRQSDKFTPTGTIAAADVEAAIAEVAQEAIQKSANLSDVSDVTVARQNLASAKSGANSDITSVKQITITGDTQPSPIWGTNFSNLPLLKFPVNGIDDNSNTIYPVISIPIFNRFRPEGATPKCSAISINLGVNPTRLINWTDQNNSNISRFQIQTSQAAASTWNPGLVAWENGSVSVGYGASATYNYAPVSSLTPATNGLSVSGNSGFGTTTPGAKLQVSGGLTVTSSTSTATDPGSGNLLVNGNITSLNTVLANRFLVYKSSDTVGDAAIELRRDSAVGLWSIRRTTIGAGEDLLFESNESGHWSTSLFLKRVGNKAIGIGTPTPGAKLQVSGGLAVTSSTSAATDPGAGNVSVTGNVSVNGGTLSLLNSTSNLLAFTATGVAAPSLTTRSLGTKILLFSGLSGTTTDFAIGIESSTIWSSIPANTNTYQFKWYGGTTELMRLRGDGNLGLGTGTPGTKLQVAGGVSITSSTSAATDPGAGNLSVSGNSLLNGLSIAYTAKTTNYTATLNDCAIAVDATTASTTITLPTAVGNTGKLYRIKKIDATANTIVIATNPNTETIDGAATVTLSAQNASADVVSNGTNWFIF